MESHFQWKLNYNFSKVKESLPEIMWPVGNNNSFPEVAMMVLTAFLNVAWIMSGVSSWHTLQNWNKNYFFEWQHCVLISKVRCNLPLSAVSDQTGVPSSDITTIILILVNIITISSELVIKKISHHHLLLQLFCRYTILNLKVHKSLHI